MFEQKKVLVTGATGLIGSNLVRRLLDENAYVVAMGRSEKKLRYVFKENDANLSFLEGNITDGIPSYETFDYIFHAASPISGAEIRTMPVDTISANIDGAKKCLEYIKRQGKGRLILFSSATVYGNHLESDSSFSEDETTQADALDFANAPYSESKRMIEVISRAYYDQYKVDSVIVRIGYVYGFTCPCPNTAFYEFIKNAVNGEDIILNNSGMGRRDNIHVSDVVEGLLIVAQKGEPKGAYNLSSNGELGNFRAIDEIASIISNISYTDWINTKISAVIKPCEGERKPGMRLSNKKVKSLGWSVKMSLEDGISETLKKYMYLKNGE